MTQFECLLANKLIWTALGDATAEEPYTISCPSREHLAYANQAMNFATEYLGFKANPNIKIVLHTDEEGFHEQVKATQAAAV